MRKILSVLIVLIVFYSCSNDNAVAIEAQQTNTEQPSQAIRQYKLFPALSNLPLEYFTFKVKRGNGNWITQQTTNGRFTVQDGDSIHFSSNGHYSAGNYSYVKYQVNTSVDWWDDSNYVGMIQLYNMPIEKKIKLELP